MAAPTKALRPYFPLLTLAVVAPTIPELLTGSTPVTTVFVDPLLFLLQFAGLVALYGGGAILIREFCVRWGKGWPSILLLGAAYGIGEEGFAVHTFFAPSGAPVYAFGVYGHALGVDWLWALGLVVFHATYSIALPILLVGLWFPEARERRWLGRAGIALTAAAYLTIVTLFALVVGHGPSPQAFAFFLGLAVLLIALAGSVPKELLRPRQGPARVGPWAIAVAGSLPFDMWTVVLIQSQRPILPATVAAVLVGLAGLGALALLVRYAGSGRPEWTKFYLATGMLGGLFVWDFVVEFAVPGILLVTAVFLGLLVGLRGTLLARDRRAWEAAPAGPRPVA